MKKTDTHEWVHIEDKIATVGITKRAREELGEIVFVALPSVGHRVKKGEEIVVLESTKAASDSYAPLTGKVVAVNERLFHNPDLINKSPEDLGWLYKLAWENEKEYQALEDF